MRTTQLLMLVAFGLLATNAMAEPSYLGTKACKKCHLKEYEAWAKTKMSQSFELLKPNVRVEEKKKAKLDPAKDYTTDAKCLACHTVGYDKPGGYVQAAEKEYFVGTGCEMCHGAGGDYVRDDRMSTKNKEFKTADLAAFGFVSKPTEAQCKVCHNEKSPMFKPFNFEERKKQGVHDILPLKYQH